MAFSSALSRALSTAVPLAARATSRPIHHAAAPLLRSGVVPRELRRMSLRALPSQRRCFSTVSSDANLIRVIEAELQYALDSADADEGSVPTKFPFNINDKPGQGIVTLTRDFHGENIHVIVSMPSIEDDEEGGENDDKENNEDGQSSTYSIPLVVTVSKRDGSGLEFNCTAYPDEIAIESLSVKEPEHTGEDFAYEGPEFSDLDEDLQKAFHKYLEIRGITTATTNFLQECMIKKDEREYISWMKNVRAFLEK